MAIYDNPYGPCSWQLSFRAGPLEASPPPPKKVRICPAKREDDVQILLALIPASPQICAENEARPKKQERTHTKYLHAQLENTWPVSPCSILDPPRMVLFLSSFHLNQAAKGASKATRPNVWGSSLHWGVIITSPFIRCLSGGSTTQSTTA